MFTYCRRLDVVGLFGNVFSTRAAIPKYGEWTKSTIDTNAEFSVRVAAHHMPLEPVPFRRSSTICCLVVICYIR